MIFSNSCKFYNFSSAQKVVKVVRNLPKCCKTQWISQILATFTTFATFWKKFPWGSPRFSRNNQLVGLGQIEYTKPLTGGGGDEASKPGKRRAAYGIHTHPLIATSDRLPARKKKLCRCRRRRLRLRRRRHCRRRRRCCCCCCRCRCRRCCRGGW